MKEKQVIKPRLYLETTIPSYLTAWASRDIIVNAHQQITPFWWKERKNDFDIYISQFVLDEASSGDADAAKRRIEIIKAFPKLEILNEVTELSNQILSSGLIPKKEATDVAHIAIAAVHKIDFLMTWNCRHLANTITSEKISTICKALGFDCPVICTPETLMGDERDDY
ncbi:MAG: type II toxin-antitoxin system VapC family toxin [Candidatus Parabeggiatoa sp.]|nr:type II toxin-antitoxin system VapC family toxin [Candidatus Parabeggiatoa sp.]